MKAMSEILLLCVPISTFKFQAPFNCSAHLKYQKSEEERYALKPTAEQSSTSRVREKLF
jgi:hypothetical protein